MHKPVTLKDVAIAAGVHVSTVSRALDPKSKTSLSDEVSDRIKRVVQELGYRPNRIAAGLRTKKSMSIGVMIPDITNTIFPPIVRGIESILEPLGYASILVNTDNIPEREKRLLEVLRERGVDGIITGAVHLDGPGVAEAVASGVPVVTLNRRLQHSTVAYVVQDDDFGIRSLVKHLHDLGHRRIAHIAGPADLSTGQMRLQSYKSSCESLKMEDSAATYCSASGYDEAEGERCAKELMTKFPDVTALVCGNDRLAIGAYNGLAKLGLSVPSDVSVTGFNDSPMLTYVKPGLTTVHVQQFETGQVSARLLLKAIDGDLGGPIGSVLSVSLVVRDSTAAPRRPR